MSKKPHILFAEDEPTLAHLIVDNLKEEGYKVTHSEDGSDVLKLFYEVNPDLVLLDIMMPKTNGYKVAKSIRNTDRQVPIIFLTAKIRTEDVVKGFEAGANDYIRKPFAMEELSIRIKALLQKEGTIPKLYEEGNEEFVIGNYSFNSQKQILIHPEKGERSLTSKESELLKLLCEHRNSLLPKTNILLKVWGDDSFFHSRSMDVFISKLRKYLKEDSNVVLLNIRGEGYKLVIG